jgi:hypothetical protein
MTEAATHNVAVVTPARSRRKKDPAAAALAKRLSPFWGKFIVEAMMPAIREIGTRLAIVERNAANLRDQNNRLERQIADT